MGMRIEVKLKCDQCGKVFATKTVRKHGHRSDYQAFPELLIVEYEREQATVQIIKGTNDSWTGDDRFGVEVGCSIKCVMALAKKRVDKLVRSKETQGD